MFLFSLKYYAELHSVKMSIYIYYLKRVSWLDEIKREKKDIAKSLYLYNMSVDLKSSDDPFEVLQNNYDLTMLVCRFGLGEKQKL